MHAARRGELITSLLHGGWRGEREPASGLSREALRDIVPILCRTGSAALGWSRLRDSSVAESIDAQPLRQGYRIHALQAAVHDEHVEKVFALMDAAGIAPILAKGWAAARLYADPALRPYGDIDLYLRPEETASARLALSRAGESIAVDLHRGSAELNDRPFDEIFRRTRLVSHRSVRVRVLGPEDHLRLLCLHALRHGIGRPLWLCDIGAAVEALPDTTDWSYLLSGDPIRTHYMLTALALACQQLGAGLDETLERDEMNLASWLVPSLHRSWGRGDSHREPIRSLWLRPGALLEEIPRHWPSAIETTVEMRQRFDETPRLSTRLTLVLKRALACAR